MLEFTVPLKEPDRQVVVVLEFTVPLTRWKQRAQQMGGSGAVVYCTFKRARQMGGSGAVVYCTFNTVEAKSPTEGW